MRSPRPDQRTSSTGQAIISNGFGKFPLALAAAEAAGRGRLACFVTGAYPIGLPGLCAAAPVLARSPRLQRLRARRESIPTSLVRSLWVSELIGQLGYRSGGKNREHGLAKRLIDLGHARYAKGALRCVERTRHAALYHYRSGYGLESVAAAKRLGMVTLCHHSIAHPAVLASLVESTGDLPATGSPSPAGAFWRRVLDDIAQADHVLTNSEFVRDTFLHQGWAANRVHTIYFGLDDAFLEYLTPACAPNAAAASQGPVRLAFAGEFSRRKGALIMIDALARLAAPDWELEIIGPVDKGLARAHKAFFADSRVHRLGTLSRQALATRLEATELFVFPSLAEGSARVVFEALACGCAVITTPNSGSIVEDGIHGRVVPAGDSTALAQAIEAAITDRDLLASTGAANAALIRESYRQAGFGDRLEMLYRKLLEDTRQVEAP